MAELFQSTPPVRGATIQDVLARQSLYISIHAPREGGDAPFSFTPLMSFNFNPRPP